MSVLDKLAVALGRNDERPNVELAGAIAGTSDTAAIAELITAMTAGTVPVQNDAIKVLYEIGALKPALIAPHIATFLALLKSRNNRNVWGALQAIDTITSVAGRAVATNLDAILAAADKGSVIAKDKAMSILAQLAAAGYAAKTVPLLISRLLDAADNQLPMYAEIAAPVIGPAHKAAFVAVLHARLEKLDQPAKRARVEKVLRKLS